MTETTKQTTTLQGTSEEIGGMVLQWAGLDYMWDEHELGADYNPTTDVVEMCDGDGLSVDCDDWEADRPMYSEIDYEVWIRDPEKAKASLLKQIWMLINRRDKVRR
jgi:hypothetical protein